MTLRLTIWTTLVIGAAVFSVVTLVRGAPQVSFAPPESLKEVLIRGTEVGEGYAVSVANVYRIGRNKIDQKLSET